MMSQEQFVYWLRGFIAGKDYLCTKETDILREELGKISVITYSPLSPPVITPLHEPYIKGPSDYDRSKMPIFT
jgi:hypothetical protein